MSKQRTATVLAALALIAAATAAAQEGAVTSPGIRAASLQEARDLAAEKNLPILIDFYADW